MDSGIDASSNTQPGTLDRAAIVEMVISSLQDVMELSDREVPAPTQLDEGVRLIGRKGVLDSMGLVNLIVDIEQRLEEECDLVVVLADERAMSQKNSPFRSVGSLTDYVCQLAEEQA
jgi:acyl carrier protein